jgi:hypothetical protein
MIEYDHRDQIPVLLLPSSHSRRKFIEGRWNSTFHFWGYRRRADRASVQLVCLRCMSPVWHETAVLCVRTNVCSWGKSGRAADTTAKTGFDPNVWSGRALQEDFSERGDVRSCINVSGLCLEPFELRAIMDISAPAISLPVRPQWAIWVTSVRMRREDRSSISFLILSQTSAG